MVESSWRKEPELTALKADLTEIDRRIQQSLKPIEESEGKEAEEDNDVCRERHDTAEELPKEDNTAARIPSRLRQIADASGAHRDRGRGQPAGERPREERDQDSEKPTEVQISVGFFHMPVSVVVTLPARVLAALLRGKIGHVLGGEDLLFIFGQRVTDDRVVFLRAEDDTHRRVIPGFINSRV